jgi:hypothetical protein
MLLMVELNYNETNETMCLYYSSVISWRGDICCCAPLGVICLTHASIALPYLKIDVMPRERVYLTCLFNLDSAVREEYRPARWIDALGEKQS